MTHYRIEQVTVAQPEVTPAEGCPTAGKNSKNIKKDYRDYSILRLIV